MAGFGARIWAADSATDDVGTATALHFTTTSNFPINNPFILPPLLPLEYTLLNFPLPTSPSQNRHHVLAGYAMPLTKPNYGCNALTVDGRLQKEYQPRYDAGYDEDRYAIPSMAWSSCLIHTRSCREDQRPRL